MGLKFPDNDITEALDESCLGAVRFGTLEAPVRVYDDEMKDYTGEISNERAQLVFGDANGPKIARRVKFPPGVDLTGFKRRDPVRLIEPRYRLVYIPAQDGNKEYFDLAISAQGLEKLDTAAALPESKPNPVKAQEPKSNNSEMKKEEKK